MRRYWRARLLAVLMILSLSCASVPAGATRAFSSESEASLTKASSIPASDHSTLPPASTSTTASLAVGEVSSVVAGPPLPPGTLRAFLAPQPLERRDSPLFDTIAPSMTERADLRTRTGKVFVRPDGSGEAFAYTVPVHYQLADGSWVEIDNTLEPAAEGGWRNVANDTQVHFATSSPARSANQPDVAGTSLLANATPTQGPLATVIMGGATLAFLPLDAAAVQGRAEGDSIVYPSIYPGVDLRYWVLGDQLKEDLVFQQAPDRDQITFLLEVRGGQLAANADGSITFVGCTERCPTIAAPYLNDEAGSTSTHIGVALAPQGQNHYLLSYTLDMPWLTSPDRVYPVILDPTTVDRRTSASMYLEEGRPDVATCNAQSSVFIGFNPEPIQNNKQRTRGFFYFSLPTLPPGSNVTDATFFAYQYFRRTEARGYSTRLYRASEAWSSANDCGPGIARWTWNNRPAIDSTVWSTRYIDTVEEFKDWDITELVAQWMSGAFPNYGIAIYADPETSIGSAFCSSTAGGSECGSRLNAVRVRPYARITFEGAPAEGIQLTQALSATPQTAAPNTPIEARFAIKNTSSISVTTPFRVEVRGAATDFAETAPVTLLPSTTFAYTATQSFSEPGVYELIAEQFDGQDWQSLAGASRLFIRVAVPQPSPEQALKGRPSTCAYDYESVNMATGNYLVDFTDLSDPTPGLPLDVTRWYNAIDAPTVLGPFAYGTTWTYSMTVAWRPDRSAVVRMADGQLAYYLWPLDSLSTAGPLAYSIFLPLLASSGTSGSPPAARPILTYASQGKDRGTLVRYSDGTAVLTMPDQTAYHFNTDGQLARISHPHPASIELVYVDDRPVRLIHSSGTTYEITYSGSFITQITSSSGRSVSYSYSPAGDLVSVTLPDGSVYRYTYDANHRLTEIRDPNGHVSTMAYDVQGRVVSQTDALGKSSTFGYGANITDPRTVANALQQTTTYRYDANGQAISVTDAGSRTTTCERDSRGNIPTITDRTGHIWRYRYDERQNLLSETDPLSNTTSYSYDRHNNVLSETDPLSNTTRYTYDANDRLTRVTDPLGNTQQLAYDTAGNLISAKDEFGAETRYRNNQLGLPIVVTDTLGFVTRMEYDAIGNITGSIDANNHMASAVYDPQGRPTRSTNPVGTVIDLAYDRVGNLLTQTDGMGHTQRNMYDANDQVIEQHDFKDNITRYSYDALGRIIGETDALGFTTVYTYNQVGNIVARRDKDGALTRFNYDGEDRLISEIDPLSRTTTYAYDAAGQQTEVHRPCDVCAGGEAIFRTIYDNAGRVMETIDPRGAHTLYTYDPLGRVATKTIPNGGVFTYTYDPAGRLIQEVDPRNGVTTYTYDRQGRILTVRNPLGHVKTNRYDRAGNLVAATDARGAATTFTYDANDRVVATADANNATTRMEYDAADRVTKQIDALGNVTVYVYDANGNQASVTDRTGATSRTEYDQLNRPKRSIDALGNVTGTSYDAMGRVVGTTDALGGRTGITYDAAGRVVARRDVLDFSQTFVYDRADNLVEQHEPNSAVLRFSYDAAGNRVGATDALGYTHVYTYDQMGSLTAEQNERGFVTQYEYDLLNRPTAQVDPLSHLSTTTYDLAGQVVRETDFNGNPTSYTYDENGNQIRVLDAMGGVTTTVYDKLNRVIAETDPLNRTRRTEYDALGRAVKTTSPAGNVTSYGYDAEGRATQVTDPFGQVTRTAYDPLGRPTRAIDALGRETGTTYDALSRVTARTDALSRVTRYGYDTAGHLLNVIAPNGVAQGYTYDKMGNVQSEQDGNGFTVHYKYDLQNQMIAKIYAAIIYSTRVYLPLVLGSGATNLSLLQSAETAAGTPLAEPSATDFQKRTWIYTYDEVGNQTSITTPAGRNIVMRYDPLNRMAEKRYNGELFASYTYDANGNRATMTDARGTTTYTYDPLNRLKVSTDPAGRTVSHEYDPASQRIRLVYPDGAAARYAYNADGALQEVTAPDGKTTRYELDKLNRPARVAQGNGVAVNYRYDAVGNELEIAQRDASGNLFARHQYTVDVLNRRVRQVAQLPQETVTTNYTYDDLDRLVLSKGTDGSEAHYTFDSAGNRLAESGVRVKAGVAPEPYRINYSYDPADELVSADDSVLGRTTYSYDLDGFRTGYESRSERAHYGYDAEGHLAEAQAEERVGEQWLLRDNVFQRYAYDGDDRRVRTDTYPAAGGDVSLRQEYRYDDVTGWDMLQSYDSVASPSGTRYLYDQPFHKLAYSSNAATGYFQNDGLGSVLGATNAEGSLASPAGLMRYGDYGQLLGPVAALPTADGYTGYDLDSYTGLNYARNRYYDVSTGTFLTPDPAAPDREDVGDLHRYLYVQASPLDATDPLGLAPRSALCANSNLIDALLGLPALTPACRISPSLWGRSHSSSATHPLRYGSEGSTVKHLQRQLNAINFHLDVDSAFGAKTRRAVMAFQRANGLVPDGIVGPKTRAALSNTESSRFRTKKPNIQPSSSVVFGYAFDKPLKVKAFKPPRLVSPIGGIRTDVEPLLTDGYPAKVTGWIYESGGYHERFDSEGNFIESGEIPIQDEFWQPGDILADILTGGTTGVLRTVGRAALRGAIRAAVRAGAEAATEAVVEASARNAGEAALGAGVRHAGEATLEVSVPAGLGDIVESAATRCLRNSFSADTSVLTPDGVKPIGDIVVGDHVLAYNEASNTTGTYTVTATFSHVDPIVIELTLDHETIETTPEHPFYVLLRGWVQADDLDQGMSVRRADGSYGTVETVEVEHHTQRMYNLTVAEAHTFFVGEEGWLVHNANPCVLARTGAPSISAAFRQLSQKARTARWVSSRQNVERLGLRNHHGEHALQFNPPIRSPREYDLSARLVIQKGKRFTYTHEGEPRVGYWDSATNLFTATSETRGRVTILSHFPADERYIRGLTGYSGSSR